MIVFEAEKWRHLECCKSSSEQFENNEEGKRSICFASWSLPRYRWTRHERVISLTRRLSHLWIQYKWLTTTNRLQSTTKFISTLSYKILTSRNLKPQTLKSAQIVTVTCWVLISLSPLFLRRSFARLMHLKPHISYWGMYPESWRHQWLWWNRWRNAKWGHRACIATRHLRKKVLYPHSDLRVFLS